LTQKGSRSFPVFVSLKYLCFYSFVSLGGKKPRYFAIQEGNAMGMEGNGNESSSGDERFGRRGVDQ
jgi:hypothetical protein